MTFLFYLSFKINSFIDSCFKKVIDNVLTESSVKLTVEKHLLISPFPFLEDISLQLRTKLRKSFKNILNCCKVQIVYKSQRRLSSQFRFKEPLSYELMSKVVYKYRCGRCNSSYYSETDRHLRVRAGEHTGLSPLTFKKKCKPSMESEVRDHLLFCDNDPSYEEFSVLAKDSSKFSLEINEGLLLKEIQLA